MKKLKRSTTNGYKIRWTEHALSELDATVIYLNTHWTTKEVKRLAHELEAMLKLIASNPRLFPKSKSNPLVRKVSVLKYNSLYYSVNRQTIEILSFFSNRQNPKKTTY